MEKGKNEPSFYEKRQRHEYNWRFVRIKKKKKFKVSFLNRSEHIERFSNRR